MNSARYIYRSVFHDSGRLLALLASCAVVSCIFTGALGTGKALTGKLLDIAKKKTGAVDSVMLSKKYFFRADASNKFAAGSTAPILHVSGTARKISTHSPSVAGVSVIGVPDDFSAFSDAITFSASAHRSVAFVNSALAKRLALKDGDELSITLMRADMPPLDTPFIPKDSLLKSIIKTIKTIDGTAQNFADFSLDATSAAPLNIFLPLRELSKLLGLENRANLLLIRHDGASGKSPETIQNDFFRKLTIEDLELELKKTADGRFAELKSEKVFIDDSLASAAIAVTIKHFKFFSYLVNSIESEHASVPYSFVCGADMPFGERVLRENEILPVAWLADALKLHDDAQVKLSFYALDSGPSLNRKACEFRSLSALPMNSPFIDASFAPGFKFLEKSKSCKDWDTSLPIDIRKIGDRDEAYWKNHGAAPKAFISLEKAQEIWGGRFGKLSAVRYELDSDFSDSESREARFSRIKSEIMNSLNAELCGFELKQLRHDAISSVKASDEFSSIFAAMSFFSIMSGLILVGLLASSCVESKARDAGILLSVGFTKKHIQALLTVELLVPAFLGTLLGALASPIYQYFMLRFLGAFLDTAGTGKLSFPGFQALMSSLTMFLIFTLVFAFASRAVFRTAPASLARLNSSRANTKLQIKIICGVSAAIFAMTCFYSAFYATGAALSSLFFASGFFFLIAAFFILWAFLGWTSCAGFCRMSAFLLALKNLSWNAKQSLLAVFSLAFAFFLVATVGLNKKSFSPSALLEPRSPSGGFHVYAVSSLPLFADLNSIEGKRRFGIDNSDFKNALFVQMKFKDGDDASCLNMNKSRRPPIVAVPSKFFAEAGLFSFVKAKKDSQNFESPWELLSRKNSDDVIPGIIDDSVLKWGINANIGDTIEYNDDNGKGIKIKLVASLADSIFQGNILIDERFFSESFPSISGTRMLLMKSPHGFDERLRSKLECALEEISAETRLCVDVLANLAEIENSYLEIFLSLGVLGLLLGTAGFAIVVQRRIYESKKEYAILSALGAENTEIATLAILEQFALFLTGALTGALSSAITLAMIIKEGRRLPYPELSALFAVIFATAICGFFFSWIALRKNRFYDWLRSE